MNIKARHKLPSTRRMQSTLSFLRMFGVNFYCALFVALVFAIGWN